MKSVAIPFGDGSVQVQLPDRTQFVAMTVERPPHFWQLINDNAFPTCNGGTGVAIDSLLVLRGGKQECFGPQNVGSNDGLWRPSGAAIYGC